ncbi:MAG TPA: histidine phosphatase family protein [Lentzea sp.]
MDDAEYVLGVRGRAFSHVLLFRHGRTDGRPDVSERDRGLSEQGREQVEQVARRLAEHLALHQDEIEVSDLVHGDYDQVKQTVMRIRSAMVAEGVPLPGRQESTAALNPRSFAAAKGEAPRDVADLRKGMRNATGNQALLVVGHEPQLSQIARALVRRRFGGAVCETPSAGVTCISRVAGKSAPQVHWVIEPSNPEVTELLRKKIASKIDVAKVFGGVVTLLLGFVLNLIVSTRKPGAEPLDLSITLSAAALAAGLVLYVSTLYGLDSLLMPPRFWTSSGRDRRRPLRPPSSADLVLQQNMIGIWNRRFTPANGLVLLGLCLLAESALGISWLWIGGAVALAVIVSLLHRSSYGAND